MMLIRYFLACLFLLGATEHALAKPQNLALGKVVRFSNPPNYKLTSNGGSDTLDLTDGKLSTLKKDRLWFDQKSVGFSYIGLEQMALDLETVQPIDEVAIRFQGGASQAHINTPAWIDIVVSDDGKIWHKVASFSNFNKNDHRRFHVPPLEGKAWVHKFRFKNLKTRARYVGVSFYGAGLSVSDELWVLRGRHDPQSVSTDDLPVIAFDVEKPHPYFHKPTLCFATNQALPNPVGLTVPEGSDPGLARLELDLPAGVRLVTGGHNQVEEAPVLGQFTVDGESYTRYQLEQKYTKSIKSFLRLFLTGDWPSGQQGQLRYRFSCNEEPQAWHTLPIEAVHLPLSPQPKRLQTGLSWFYFDDTIAWPGSLTSMAHLGLNNVTIFRHHSDDDHITWNGLEDFQQAGYKTMVVDSPFHHLIDNEKDNAEIFMRDEQGQATKKFNPSYRGPLYQKEINRLASQAAKAKADYLIYDIELWGASGPQEAKHCSLCQADFAKGGYSDWEAWMLDKGEQIATDLSDAVRAAAGKPIDMGSYDFRPGQAYHRVWPFDRLYPKHINHSQVSTYTTLEPYHIELIGDEVREDRRKLHKSDQMPWITPGDAGSFPGEKFRYALLEAFANGSRGVLFWSGRVWDTENLAAYSRAIRNVTPVEDIILDGTLLDSITTHPKTRVSGMKHEDSVFLLVSDYSRRLGGKTVAVTLPVSVKSLVVDLDTGQTIAQIGPANPSFRIDFRESLARPLHVVPSKPFPTVPSKNEP